MAESNPTQVILTDDGIKIIKAQNTADNAASGVTNLNDPNLMSVIEKQNDIGQFAGLTSQYNVIVQNAKDDGIDTTAVATAYNNLNKFMADILADPDHASDIDRVTYKKYQDAYNEELSKLQNALQNNTNDKFTSAASALSQAASTANVAKSAADSTYAYANSEIAVQSTATAKAQSAADNAFSKAQEVGSQADSAIAVQSNATAKAQSTADSAFSQAVTAIDTGKATSQAVTALKDGSTLTIAQLGNGLASKVSNSEYASYKEQTASQIGQMVTNGAFSAYQQTTADLISAKVATKDFTAYQATTAKAIDSKVESKDFNTYKTQTDSLINDKVSNSEYASDREQTASQIADRVSNSAFSTYQEQTASQIASKVDSGDFSTYKTQTADLISSKVATKDFSAYQDTTAKAIESKVESKDFNTYKTQTDSAIESKVSNADFSTYKTQTATDINLKVAAKDLIDQINIQAGNTLISSSGQLTLSGKNINFDTNNPVIIPSANIDTLLVDKKLTAADISANTFTTNNGTFMVDKNGAITAKNMTLTGGTLTSPTINTSTINGSTINGTTFNAGNRIENPNNTAGYYPMTITPDGSYKSTYFDSAVGLQSSVESGAISYKYRSMIGSGQYLAYDSVINGQGFESQSGYTSAKDTTFSNPEKITGYVNVTPASGIYLYGPTQKINFAGNADNIGSNGITMDAYGNMYAQANSTYWRIRDIKGNDIADFGIDTAGSNNIFLHRELDIGNFQINPSHTFTSADGDAIHFAKGKGGAVDIYAGDVHYNSLVKSSLLSVKKDVKKADTAYWAQLVNSIDLATYQYKTDDNTSHLRLSSIVDDVNVTKQWQLPDVFISRDENGKLNGVDDSVLLNATLATVQEQQKEIDQLNGHNMQLEARLNKLEAKLNG